MKEAQITTHIKRELEAQAGLSVIVEETNGTILLSGRVDSAEARQAAEDIATELAPGQRIDNDLEVDVVSPTEVSTSDAGRAVSADLPESVDELRAADSELEPDFTDQPLSTSGLETSGVDTGEEDDTVYFPPTDPVITTDAKGNVEVLGGFAPTSMDQVEVAPSALDGQPGDEALADAIRDELRRDALTTDLQIDVRVVRGVAHLRGVVTALEDAEHAEAVAADVPGVREVVEELTIPEL